jgi:hypothetical protein
MVNFGLAVSWIRFRPQQPTPLAVAATVTGTVMVIQDQEAIKESFVG